MGGAGSAAVVWGLKRRIQVGPGPRDPQPAAQARALLSP